MSHASAHAAVYVPGTPDPSHNLRPLDFATTQVSMPDTVSILDQLQLFPLPIPPSVTPRPITSEERARIDTLGELQFFLATAPTRWNQAETVPTTNLTKFQLPNGEYVSCVLWNGLYHITGTDIVRALAFRFEAFGRPVKATKKWEEGVFSDLRNLKPGLDASLEEPKSPLLDFLFRNGCIRTQKKQKVFYWFSVPHDRLFLDALERDLKREKALQPPTSEVVGEPARSFRYDPRRSLFEQFAGQNPGLAQSMLTPGMDYGSVDPSLSARPSPAPESSHSGFGFAPPMQSAAAVSDPGVSTSYRASPAPPNTMSFQRTLFEGSPSYKKRRVRSRQGTSPSAIDDQSMRRGSPGPRSFSVEMRGGTNSPRPSHSGLRNVSGQTDREDSPSVKRERDESMGPEYEFHAGEKMFVCAFDSCRRPFKRLEHLRRHVRTHTQERPFKCHKCTRTFARQDNLTQHLRTHDRLDELSNNPGLGLGTPPPREGIDYHIVTAGSGVEVAPYRWPSASPAPGGDVPMQQPYRAMGSMPPPSLPYSSRHSTAPPEWSAMTPDPTMPNGQDITFADHNGVRRFRSVTPSAIYNPIMQPPPPGWGQAAAPPQMAPVPYQFAYWRPPSDLPYVMPPQPVSAVGSIQQSPIISGDYMSVGTPISYGDPATESYPTPSAD